MKLSRVVIVTLSNPCVSIAQQTGAYVQSRAWTYSKTYEYNTFRTLNSCIPTSNAPKGKETTASIKLPANPTVQMAAEHIPPIKISCHQLYNDFLHINASSSMDASDTDSSSCITYPKTNNSALRHVRIKGVLPSNTMRMHHPIFLNQESSPVGSA